MTALVERPSDVPAVPAEPARSRWAALASPGWIPFLGAVAFTGAFLVYYGVGAGDLVHFAAYTLLAGTLPGTLIWRAVQGGAGLLALDAAFGTVAGFVVELPVYLLVREFGVPLAVLAWPIATILLFAVVPRPRRFWRGSGQRLPLGVSWTIALGFVFVLVSIAVSNFRFASLIEPYQASMSMDYPFQFALVGEFKHLVPLSTPWLLGSALQYHWYVYAHGAAASWLTGIEPQTLILRLLPLPMVAAFLVIMVAVVRRLTGRWWPGNVAVLLTLLGCAVSPWAWTDRPMPTGTIMDNLWISPTQTYAALFFLAVVYVLTGVLRAGRPEVRRPVPWIVLTLLLGAVAGAKATFLPMVLCGLVLAVAIRFLATRRAGPELAALGITLGWFAFAQLVLYHSASYGAEVHPLQTVKFTQLGQAVLGRQGPVDDFPPLIALTLIGVLATAFGWAGIVGLLRREQRLDPVLHVMLGFAAAGVGGMWLVAHPGLSQTYFGRSASPYLAMLSAIGLAALIPAGRQAPRGFAILAASGAVLTGAGLIAVRQTIGHDAPPSQFDSWTLGHAVTPYLVVVGIIAVPAVAVALIGRRAGLRRGQIAAAIVIITLSTAVTSGVVGTTSIWTTLTTDGRQRYATGEGGVPAMPPGAIQAGRWLRDHSGPRDLVATNSHCRINLTGCDSRDFWLAAYSERQVLVEGWSYTEQSLRAGGLYDGTLAHSQFWDPALLAANDAVFYTPTAANVAAFTRGHHVRWLVAVNGTPNTNPAVRRYRNASPDLAKFATERFHAGTITVYEVTASGLRVQPDRQ